MNLRTSDRSWRTARRGSVSVEVALLVVLLLLPLLVAALDFTFTTASRIENASALRAVETYGEVNPSLSTSTSDITSLLAMVAAHDLSTVALGSPPSLSFACLTSDGKSAPASVHFNDGYSAASLSTAAASTGLAATPVPASSEQIGNGVIGYAQCDQGSVQALVTYQVTTSVAVPLVAAFFKGTNFKITTTGTVWVH